MPNASGGLQTPALNSASDSPNAGSTGSTGYESEFVQPQATATQTGVNGSVDPPKKKRRRGAPRSKNGTAKCRDCKRKTTEVVTSGTYMMVTKCGHVFCHPCVKKMRKNSTSMHQANCVSCHAPFMNNSLRRVYL